MPVSVSVVLLLVSCLVVMGQTGTPTRTTWTTAPSAVTAFEAYNYNLPATAVQMCSTGTVLVTRTSGTVLSLANGSAAATPQYIRFNPRTRAVTAAVTLTISSGTGSGNVDLYGFILPSGAFEFRAVNSTSNVLALASGTVVPAGGAQDNETRTMGIKFYSWTITSGAWATTGTDHQTAPDCWIDYMEVSNRTAAAVDVTVTDGLGTPMPMFTTANLDAESTWVVVVNGGRYFEKGMKVTVGTAESVAVYVRGGKR